jgi:alpha-L-fucosidase 2
MEQALKKNYNAEYHLHVKRYQSLFNKANFRLDNNVIDTVSTDKRLVAFAINRKDQLLPVLYFQFGRYLLISSTRKGLLPPNLQGLWANSINTPWNGDYHININLQMNHWPLEVTNLASLNEPFYQFVNKMVPAGQKTARAYYNAPGWVAHVITNVWQYTSPGENYSWGSFNTGAAWLCQMLWSHYEFTRDRNYLQNIYPILHGAATFYAASLVKDSATGYRVTAPSNSPENGFILPDENVAHVCAGPTIDNQLLRFLFRTTSEAAQTLQIDKGFSLKLDSLFEQLPPNQIGSDGRLLEWQKPYREYEPKHRHISHLWGLYPGYEINNHTPDLQAAAKATLKARGDEGTGWSLAWKINFWARLHDGNKAMQFLQRLLRPTHSDGFNMVDGGGTYPNLFCAHPPFQIDGNFGGTAGIAEMLVQSHENYIELLPALPTEWPNGFYNGLCVRGGANIAIAWKNSNVQTLQINATHTNTFTIKLPANVKAISRKSKNGFTELSTENGFLIVPLQKGESATFKFDATQ